MIEPNTIVYGDCLDVLKKLPDGFVQCCVTSPPYWGLRNYGVDGQLGLEKTPEEYVAKMMEVFREVRRVLRDDGTLWLNLGDSYAQSSYGSGGGWAKDGSKYPNAPAQYRSLFNSPKYEHGLKSKDLVGIPWMVAFALRADGWYLRQDIIWHKPNPMPESVTDRCTKAHEYIFLLSKSQKYYYDAEAIKEPASYNTHERIARAKIGQKSNPTDKISGIRPRNVESFSRRNNRTEESFFTRRKNCERKLVPSGSGIKNNDSFGAAMAVMPDERNKRSVWSVCTEAYPEAHYATFPQDLIKPCILAGAPEQGIVFDPFMGSGTTALVARNLNRRYIGIELNPKNKILIEKRLAQERLPI